MDVAIPRMADVLLTSRLHLRAFTPSDLAELHDIFSDSETHTIGNGPVASIDDTRHWLERRGERRQVNGVTWYAIRREADGTMIGNCGLFMGRTDPHPELWLEIRHADQNHGFGREAAEAVTREAHRAGFAEVWATVRDWNGASLRALGRVGFVRDRTEHDKRGSLTYLLHRDLQS